MAPRKPFDRRQIEAHLGLIDLRDGDHTWEVLVRGGRTETGFYDDPSRLVDLVESRAGFCNFYVSINPCVPPADWPRNRLLRRSTRDVRVAPPLRHVLIDIDVCTPGRRKAALVAGHPRAPSTHKEQQSALHVAKSIVEIEGYDQFAIFLSGNGVQVLLPVSLPADAAQGQSTSFRDSVGRIKAFIEDLRTRYREFLHEKGVSIDSTWPAAQKMALAGAIKIKGRESSTRKYRMVSIDHVLWEAGRPSEIVTERLRALGVADAPMEAIGGGRHIEVPARLQPIPDWCDMWNSILMKAPESRRQGYSGTIWTVALKLSHEGYQRDDAVALLTRFDETHRQKYVNRARSEQAFEKMLHAASLTSLSCASAEKLSPRVLRRCKDCDRESRPARAKVLARIPALSESSKAPSIGTAATSTGYGSSLSVEGCDLETARALLRARLHDYIFHECKAAGAQRLWTEQHRRDRNLPLPRATTPPVLLVRGPPGLGKSTVLAWLLAQRSDFRGADGVTKQGWLEEPKFLLLAPRHDRMEELAADLRKTADELGEPRRNDTSSPPVPFPQVRRPKRAFLRIYGKLAKDGSSLCTQPDRLRQLRSRGFGKYEYRLGCKPCPSFSGCQYWEQFRNRDENWLMPMQFAGTGRIEKGNDNDPDIFVADEGILSAANPRPQIYSSIELREAAQLVELRSNSTDPLVRVLRQLAEAAEDFPSCTGRVLYSFLEAEIPNFGEQLREGLAHTNLVDNLRYLPEFALEDLAHGAKNVVLLLEALKEDLDTRRHIGLVRIEDSNAISVHELPTIDFRDKPTIILDSSGDPEIYHQVLGREVEDFDVSLPLEAEVIQLADGRYSKTTLTNPRNKSLEGLIDVLERIEDGCLGPLAMICHREVEETLRARFGDRIAIYLHYWAVRGSNALVELGCSDLVLVGTPTPKIDELARRVEALDGVPHQPVWTTAPRRYGWLDDEGFDREVEVPVQEDSTLQRWLELHREQEMSQAAFRIRPLDASPQKKRIWILSSLPVPRCPPNRLFENKEGLLTWLEDQKKW